MKRTLPVLFVLLLALPGCMLREEILDIEHVEDRIEEDLRGQLGGDVEFAVTCPDGDRPVEEGDTFECVAEGPEGSVTVLVTQIGGGDVEYQIRAR